MVEKALSTDDETMQSFHDCWRETGLAQLQGDRPSSSCNFNLHIDVHQLPSTGLMATQGKMGLSIIELQVLDRHSIDLHQPELSCTELSLDFVGSLQKKSCKKDVVAQ